MPDLKNMPSDEILQLYVDNEISIRQFVDNYDRKEPTIFSKRYLPSRNFVSRRLRRRFANKGAATTARQKRK